MGASRRAHVVAGTGQAGFRWYLAASPASARRGISAWRPMETSHCGQRHQRIRWVDALETFERSSVVGAADMGRFDGKLAAPSQAAWVDACRVFVAGGTSGGCSANMLDETVSGIAGEPGGAMTRTRRRVDRAPLRDASGIVSAGVFTLRSERKRDPQDVDLRRSIHMDDRDVDVVRRSSDRRARKWPTVGSAIAPTALYVADAGRHVIRVIDVDRELVTAAPGHIDRPGPFGADGPWMSCFSILRSGRGGGRELYVADKGNNRVLRVASSSVTGELVVMTVLGDGSPSSGGEGAPARAFPVHAPRGLAFDAFGNLFVTSTNTVRVVSPGPSGVVDGDGSVHTIYGARRDAFPMSITHCLTGIHVATDDTSRVAASIVRVFDGCQGFMLELARISR